MVGIEAVFGPAGHRVGRSEHGDERRHRKRARQRMRAHAPQLGAEQPQRPDRDTGVQQPEERAGADQPELRHEQQRERDGHGQRAEVVEGEDLRDQVFQAASVIVVASASTVSVPLREALQDAHHKRNFQPDEQADEQHQGVQREAERWCGERLQREQRRRHQPADQTHEQLDAQEVRDQLALEEARQVGAQPHREQVGADDGRELQDRVAEQVAGERAGGQLVDEATSGDDEDRGEQRDFGGAGARRFGRRVFNSAGHRAPVNRSAGCARSGSESD